jgi:hypothetical protein
MSLIFSADRQKFRPVILAGLVVSSSCLWQGCGDGSDNASFVSTMQISQPSVGARHGHFIARLQHAATDFSLLAALISERIGYQARIEPRFPGIDRMFADKSRNLNQLVKVQVEGAADEATNATIFVELQELVDDTGELLFATIDTDKHVFRDQSGNSSDALGGRQYYLDMIGWQDTMALLAPDVVNNAAPVVVGGGAIPGSTDGTRI